MKYEVKVGRTFDGEITITMTNGDPKTEPSFKKVAVVVLAATILMGMVAACAYGLATGDYSPVKAISEAITKLIEVVVKIATKEN